MAKRALLVGINKYRVERFNLRGCVNDVHSLASLLVGNYGFSAGNITILKDEAATRPVILDRLSALLSHASSGDTLIFGFSGHGTQAASQDPGEEDRKDECLVPHESNFSSLIKDDELFGLYNSNIHDPSIKFTSIIDCCHSGTMLRSLDIDETGEFAEESINRVIDLGDFDALQTKSIAIGPFNVLSACQDDETAADLRSVGEEGQPRGAFSFALHNFLRANKDTPASVAEDSILNEIKSVSRHTQNPNYVTIESGAPLIRY